MGGGADNDDAPYTCCLHRVDDGTRPPRSDSSLSKRRWTKRGNHRVGTPDRGLKRRGNEPYGHW